MGLGNANPNTGNQGSNWRYEYASLKLLETINASILAIPVGIDYETRTTTYIVITAGAGYAVNDIIVRYDIIDVATSILISTLWFNQTDQTTIAAPVSTDITPYSPPGNVTVANPFNLEVTQLEVRDNVTSKMNRIKGSADYNRALTYFAVATPEISPSN